MVKKHAAIALGKAIFYSSRFLKRGGGFAAPGLYSLKVDSNLISKLINHKAKNIVITGTNGKTTTSQLLSHFFEAAGNKILRNSSGSNLERGIASYLLKHSSFSGKVDYDFGIWELDEFAFNSVMPKIKPDAIVLLNVFRDQLDRYGEVDTVIKRWQKTLEQLSPETLLIINSDDINLLRAAENFKGKIVKIGLKDSQISGESKSKSLIDPDFQAELVKSQSLESSKIKVSFENLSLDFEIPLPGVFNIYNFLAAFTLAYLFNTDVQVVKNSLVDFSPAFGRFEKFNLNGKEGNIFLIKNPVGATQVFQTILPHISNKDSLLLALNDNFADGTDVSWIWDISLENFQFSIFNFQILVSGVRVYDMALRLKYADVKNMEIEEDLETAFEKAFKETQGKVFILPTYTALMELQKILVNKGIKKEYWK